MSFICEKTQKFGLKILNQTLSVFSQMKDIQHIRGDFHSVALVMPKGRDLHPYLL